MSLWARARAVGHWVDWPATTYGTVGSAEYDHWDTALYELKNREVNVVADYGLVAGGSGSAVANTAAISLALSDAQAAGIGSVYIPAGTYTVDPAASIIHPGNIQLRGDGPGVTVLQQAAAASGLGALAFVNADSTNGNNNGIVRGLTFDGNRANRLTATNNMFRLIASDSNRCTNWTIEDVEILNSPFASFQFMNCSHLWVTRPRSDNSFRDGLTFWFNSDTIHITDPVITNAGDDCIAFNAEVTPHIGTQIQNVSGHGGYFHQRGTAAFGTGMRVAGVLNFNYSDFTVAYSQGWGVLVEGGFVSGASVPSQNVNISNFNIDSAGSAASGNGAVATTSTANGTRDVNFSNFTVKDFYSIAVQLGTVATVTGYKIRGGQLTTSQGIVVNASGCVIGPGTVTSVPSNGISVNAEKVTITAPHLIDCCLNQSGGAYLLIGAGVNRVSISQPIMQRVTNGAFGLRIATGTSTGISCHGGLAQTFTAGNGFSNGASGTVDLTLNQEI